VGPRAGLDTEVRGKILSPLPGIEPRSPGRPARSQTLHRLSYPAHNYEHAGCIILMRRSWNFRVSGSQIITERKITNNNEDEPGSSVSVVSD
jgi:hypothetical protein